MLAKKDRRLLLLLLLLPVALGVSTCHLTRKVSSGFMSPTAEPTAMLPASVFRPNSCCDRSTAFISLLNTQDTQFYHCMEIASGFRQSLVVAAAAAAAASLSVGYCLTKQ
jgi:hypothetical protein